MNWKRLQNNECPSCGSSLAQDARTMMIVCSKCSFKINESRLAEILRFGYKPVAYTVDEEEKKLQELNNLGRKPFNPYNY